MDGYLVWVSTHLRKGRRRKEKDEEQRTMLDDDIFNFHGQPFDHY